MKLVFLLAIQLTNFYEDLIFKSAGEYNYLVLNCLIEIKPQSPEIVTFLNNTILKITSNE